jgi:hypothetical protein
VLPFDKCWITTYTSLLWAAKGGEVIPRWALVDDVGAKDFRVKGPDEDTDAKEPHEPV